MAGKVAKSGFDVVTHIESYVRLIENRKLTLTARGLSLHPESDVCRCQILQSKFDHRIVKVKIVDQ